MFDVVLSQFGLWPTLMTFFRLVSLADAILVSRKNIASARNATIDSGR